MPHTSDRTDAEIASETWSIETISAIAEVKTGPFGSNLHERDYVESGTPIVTVEHLSERGILHRNLPLVSDSERLRLKRYSLRAGDIVFSRVGAVDRNALVRKAEEGWLFSGRLLRVRVYSKSILPAYLSYYLHSEHFRRRIREVAVGQTMASLNTRILEELQVAFPPLPEQHEVAETLSDIDGLLQALEALIVKKRAVKQAAMQQLLTGNTRLPGFGGTWDPVVLGNVAAIRDHKVLPSTVPPATPCVELDHIGQTAGRLIGRSTARQSISLKYVFLAGDVLFGRLRPYLRKYWRADCDGICTTEIWPLRPDSERLDGRFLYVIVQSDRFVDLASVSYGTHMPRADWSVLRNLEIRLPGICEQRAIAGVLSEMDAEIAALERRLDKTRAIKQGMMQQLLTGRVRLVKPEQADATAAP